MLKAITASKKKNDRVDARKIADALRADLLPECHMASARIRELRRLLRYRNLVVRQAVTMKNKMAGLLMEVGAEYNKKRLHGKRYFAEFLESVEEVPESVVGLLRMSRASVEMFDGAQRQLLDALAGDKALGERVALLRSIPGVGEVTALEVGDVTRFASRNRLISYCGLCSAQRESAGKTIRGPLSKERNKHLQRVLIEAAKLAPRWNPALAALREREVARGDARRGAAPGVLPPGGGPARHGVRAGRRTGPRRGARDWTDEGCDRGLTTRLWSRPRGRTRRATREDRAKRAMPTKLPAGSRVPGTAQTIPSGLARRPLWCFETGGLTQTQSSAKESTQRSAPHCLPP